MVTHFRTANQVGFGGSKLACGLTKGCRCKSQQESIFCILYITLQSKQHGEWAPYGENVFSWYSQQSLQLQKAQYLFFIRGLDKML